MWGAMGAATLMVMIVKPVVVAVSEPEEADDAIALGLAAARLLGAPLVLAGVAVEAAVPGATDALRDAVARELHRHADAVPDDVPCTVNAVRAPSVQDGLRAITEREGAQLLVVGADDRVPRHARCPVLIAPVGALAAAP